MKARLIDLSIGADGQQRLTLALCGDFRQQWDELHDKDVDVAVKRFRERRSLDANAYFHVLCNSIARVLRTDDTYTKRHLNTEYGQIATYGNGSPVCVVMPEDVNPESYYPYMKAYGHRVMNGRRCTCYLLYKRTRELDSAEMARLINGAVEEAKALGIETLPPEELASLMKEAR